MIVFDYNYKDMNEITIYNRQKSCVKTPIDGVTFCFYGDWRERADKRLP